MVYQLAAGGRRGGDAAPAGGDAGAGSAGTLEDESRQNIRMGGKTVRRADPDVSAGRTARRCRPMTASPAAYIERMKEEGWQAQLITGFAIGAAGRDLRASAEKTRCSARRSGQTVYMILAQADEQTRCTRSARTPVIEMNAYEPRRGTRRALFCLNFFGLSVLKNGEKREKTGENGRRPEVFKKTCKKRLTRMAAGCTICRHV